jgi:hypothetical protein
LAVLLWTIVRTGKHPAEEQIAFTDFIDQVKDKKVSDVNIAGNEVHGNYVGKKPRRPAHAHPHQLSGYLRSAAAERRQGRN